MFLARILEQEGIPARELTVEAAYTFTGDWWAIDGVSFVVRGRVDGGESEPFEQAAKSALRCCGESLGLPSGDSVELLAELLP